MNVFIGFYAIKLIVMIGKYIYEKLSYLVILIATTGLAKLLKLYFKKDNVEAILKRDRNI